MYRDRQQGFSSTGAFISTAYTLKLSLRQLRLAEENPTQNLQGTLTVCSALF